MDPLWFPAYFALIMFTAALQPKALGLSIVTAIGLMALYPDADRATMLTLLYVPAYLLAGFRD